MGTSRENDPSNASAAGAELDFGVFSTLVENVWAGVYLFQDLRFLFVNRRFAEMFGYEVEELLRLGPQDLTHPDEREKVVKDLQERIAKGVKSFRFSFRGLRKDGSDFPVSVLRSTIEHRGHPAAFGMTLDMSQENRLESALHESEQHYRTLVESSIDGIVVGSGERILFANHRMAEICGYPDASHLLQMPLPRLFAPEEREVAMARHYSRLKGEPGSDHFESRGLRGDGKTIDMDVRVQRVMYDGQNAVVATVRDITESKRKQRQLRAVSEIGEALNLSHDLNQLLSLVHEQVGGLMPAKNFYVALLDPETGFVSFPYFVDEYDPAPAPRKARRGLTEYVIRTGRGFLWSPELNRELGERGELQVIGTDPASWLGVPLLHQGVAVGAIVVQTYDRQNAFGEDDQATLETLAHSAAFAIERKLADDALKASAAKYRALFETANDGIIIFSKGNILDCNRRAAELFESTCSDLAGQSLQQLLAPTIADGGQDADRLLLEMEACLRGKPASVYIRAKGFRGGRLDIEVSLSRLDIGGEPSVQAIIHDIGNRLRAEEEQARLREQLSQVQKMEAIGTLAGGVAHDFNNLLSGIIGYTSLAKRQVDAGHPLYRMFDTIEKSANRAAELTQQLLGFARRGRFQVQPTNLNEVIERVLAIISRTFDRNISIETSGGADLMAVEGDGGQLEHCLLNLCLNARDAMPSGGTLRIRARNALLDPSHAVSLFGAQPGEYVLLTVTDTGLGMDEETRKRCFEPFYTTKEKGKGTGMGLAMVYGIVKNHGGFIRVDSEEGRGTEFNVYLPATHEAVPSKISRSDDIPRGTEKVLLVDDEEVIRDMAASLLSELGYRVYVADGGEGACRIYREAWPDLVVLDVIMPGMSGGETFQELRRIDPAARILVSSGYSLDGQPSDLIRQGARGFVQKPYDLRGFALAIREALR